MAIFEEERIWRILTYLWTIFFMVFVLVNFFNHNSYEVLVIPFSVVYTGILSVYVGTKEFDRWYDLHIGRHPGEWFIIAWSILIFLLLGLSIWDRENYHLSTDIAAVYITVLSIFALTQKSKQLYRKKKQKLEKTRQRL